MKVDQKVSNAPALQEGAALVGVFHSLLDIRREADGGCQGAVGGGNLAADISLRTAPRVEGLAGSELVEHRVR